MCWPPISLGSQNYQKKCENTFKRASLQKKSHEHLEKLQFPEKITTVGSKKVFLFEEQGKNFYRFVLIVSI